jgi:hypothetical protein
MSATSSSSVTPAFIDLASFDDSEKYMYSMEGMPDYKDAVVYFVRETRKATWFTQIPVILPQTQGDCNFGSNWSVSVSRAGDYLLNTWIRMSLPRIKLKTGTDNRTIRWTQNVAHALVKEITFTSNDLVIAKFDNYHLDFWTAFTIPAGKQDGYMQMIGNTNLINPNKEQIPVGVLNLPLPFFFSRDKGLALPTASLPYTDMKINASFRDWSELLIVDEFNGSWEFQSSRPVTSNDLEQIPRLTSVQVWGTYVIIPNDERKKMACSVRDMLIEQSQTATTQSFVPEIEPNRSFDLRFSHPIKVFFFGCRNTTIKSQWSNYTSASPIPDISPDDLITRGIVDFDGDRMNDPISLISLVYDNAKRLSSMGADYFSLVNPFFNSPVIPLNTGYHCYSYSLDFINIDPMGSTNHSKLNDVSIEIEASETVLETVKSATEDKGVNESNQKFEFIVTAVNNNVLRVASGIMGFPYL